MNGAAGTLAAPVLEAPPLDRERRSAFELYREGLVHSWSGSLAALGFSLNPLFLVLDWFTAPPDLLKVFAVYRAIVTGAMVLQFFVVRATRPGPLSIIHGYVTTLLFGIEISWMTVELGGFDSSYYAGLNLVIMAVNLLLPWRPLHSALNGSAVFGMYVLLNAIFGGPFHFATLLGNLFFMGATVIIAIAISVAKHRLIENEFSLRAELVEANANLDRSRQELKVARDALWGEMEVAKRIQTALLPQNRRVGGYDVAARMLPAAEVGGDYYDIIEIEGQRSWVAIGDVSGHGVESGLVMMMTQTSILSLVQENPARTPTEVFGKVNDVLNENIGRLATNRYMTLNVVALDEGGLRLAGKHQDVLVWRRATGKVDVISNDGCWIGVVEDLGTSVSDLLVRMDEGDVALFYTDGATEAMSSSGEMFGEERLAAALARVAERSLDGALEALFAEVSAFQARQDDDITMMLVRKVARTASLSRGEPARPPPRPPAG